MIKNIQQFVEYLEKSSDYKIMVNRLILRYSPKTRIDDRMMPGLSGSIYANTVGNPDIRVRDFLNEYGLNAGMGYQEKRQASYMIRTPLELWPELEPLITFNILSNKKLNEFDYKHSDYSFKEWLRM